MAAKIQPEPELPKCPKCQSGQVYYRIKTDDYQCRRCGETFPAAKEGVTA
jgi:ribosomal protein L37AE/L43A